MPRPTSQQVNRVPALEGSKPTEVTRVVARPVDAPNLRGYDSSLDATLRGLAHFNSNLSNYLNDQGEREVQEGIKARADGSPIDDNKSEWFKHGFMKMDGQVKGQEDGVALHKAYETAFDKEGGDVEKLISDQWANNMRGMDDKSFLTGYSHSFAAAANKLRQAHLEYQKDRVVEKTRANAMSLLDEAIRSHVESGQEVPQSAIESLKGEMKQYGIGNKEFTSLLFDTVHRYGMESGNYQLFDLFKRPNQDGTPGAYFVPRWKEKIDEAQVSAQNVFLRRQTQAYEMEKRNREERQDTALYGVFEKLYSGDHDGAQVDFGQHVSSGLFSRASDIVKWEEMFRKVDNRELRSDEQATMTEALAGVVTGKLGVRDILSLELPPQAKRQLLSELRTQQTQERQLEAQGATAANRPFRDHRFKEQDDYIEKQLSPIQDFLGKFTGKNEFISAARATAKLELAEYVRANGLKDIRSKAVEIVERHAKRIAAQGDDIIDRAAKQLRYSTVGAAKAAYERGEMSDADFALHLDYFQNSLREQQRRRAAAAGK
jgi:hypothetical protein